MIGRLSFLFFVLCTLTSYAQFGSGGAMYDPVTWEGSIEEVGASTYELTFLATLEKDWHIYSQHTPDGGPLPLKIDFENPDTFKRIGDLKEQDTLRAFSDVFKVDEVFFSNTAELNQTIQVNKTSQRYIKATLWYQVCKEVCINQEFYFGFDLQKQEVKIFEDYTAFEKYGVIEDGQQSNKTKASTADTSLKKQDTRDLWTLFIIAFLSGFAALLTPCVFPMIPMTVAYFTKRSKDKIKGRRNAIIYGFFIVVIYVLLGSIVTAIFGADVLNALSTNVWFNIIFFILLVVFAVSFLGAFEIVLPNSWANAVDKRADRGGVLGIFFMALALAIVSFSCTGPIVGTLLVEAASKGGLAPIIGMLGFSLAIAIPFGLFALFPGWLNSLPKSGGWLNSVKVVLGFLELALAFKFLSNADLVLQAHWLEREVFIAIWITIFGVLALYLLGKIRLPHDSPSENVSVGRLLFGLLVLSFTIYLIPGLWGAPLKLISGFPPPMHYSESPYGVGFTKSATTTGATDNVLPPGAQLGPHQIITFTDYDKGLAYAKEVQKPILLDFTGYACVNCRKMEERVWSEPQILSILKDEVVLISLYVDDKKALPESEQYTSKTTGKRIRTIGNKWSDFQIKNYKANAQPYYVILDFNENMLSNPVGYVPDVKEYEAWLREGIDSFK